MKTIFKFSVLLFAVLIVSCKESTDMLTVVKPDGSCYRVFNETADNEFLLGDKSADHNPFPVNIDENWEISWQHKNSSIRNDFPLTQAMLDSINTQSSSSKIEGQKIKSDIIVFLRKDFRTVEEMDTAFSFRENHSWKNIPVKHRLDTKFRWFYTYFKFSETYPKIQTQIDIPLSKYMTEDEAMYWFTGQPDILKGMNGIEAREYLGKLEDNYNAWFSRNSWNAQFSVLLASYNNLINPPVNYSELQNLKDSIFDSKVKNSPDYKMEQILNEFFDTKSFSILWRDEESPMKQFESSYFENTMSYLENSLNYKLILPGKIIDPGNAIVNGDTLTWRLTAYRMFPKDFVIQATSRKANIWAFILTGLIVLIAIGSFMWKGKNNF